MTPHAVPAAVFDELAGGGGELLGVLRASQRSKRLLLVNEVVSAAKVRVPHMFRRAEVADALAVFTKCQEHSRDAVDDVLLQPHVGAWAMHCLRSLRATNDVTPEDLGHFGAIAAAAALRAGQPFDVTCFARGGSVMLPSFGRARSGADPGWCRVRSGLGGTGVEITTSGGATVVPITRGPAGTETWLPLRRLRSRTDGIEFTLDVDDLDPYRGCGQLQPAPRLGTAALEDWQQKLDRAWSLLVNDHRTSALAIAGGVTSVVPMRPTTGVPELSASTHDAIGAVAMTPPRDALAFALALVHEFQHTKLSALLDLLPLADRAPGHLFYAPWRADPRPLSGLLQGTYAYLGLTGFWEARRHSTRIVHEGDRRLAHFEFALWRDQVVTGLAAAQRSGRLTRAGERLAEGMRRRLGRFSRLDAPAAPRSMAQLASLDNAVSWRLRNARPAPDQVATWAAAWLSGRPCLAVGSMATEIVDGVGPLPSETRLALIRHRLSGRGPGGPPGGRGATSADAHLLAGRSSSAVVAYGRQIARSPDDLAAWAGLLLARRSHRSPRMGASSQRPETVVALHAYIRERTGAAPDPVHLADWLSGGYRRH